MFKPGDGKRILDFGAGKQAAHTQRLREAGYDVTAHEFGDNVVPGLHHPNALSERYDVVYASNVLNVQGSKSMLHATLDQIHGATAPGGTFVGNYPQSPRKAADVDRHVIQTALQDRYEDVSYESKRNLFVAKRPK